MANNNLIFGFFFIRPVHDVRKRFGALDWLEEEYWENIRVRHTTAFDYGLREYLLSLNNPINSITLFRKRL